MPDSNSPRDLTVHGTMTASVVGGNYVKGTVHLNYFGYANGTAKLRHASTKLLPAVVTLEQDPVAINNFIFCHASTIDRWFAGTISLGNGDSILGWSLFPGAA
ncbi:hypothetical protein M0R45_022851 [Rubus argutus]|uniref:Dirigent protein n=1 Tax=Rubus argutus TaxID=59490 RepID=A0AAW1XHJ6_RUBAR